MKLIPGYAPKLKPKVTKPKIPKVPKYLIHFKATFLSSNDSPNFDSMSWKCGSPSGESRLDVTDAASESALRSQLVIALTKAVPLSITWQFSLVIFADSLHVSPLQQNFISYWNLSKFYFMKFFNISSTLNLNNWDIKKIRISIFDQ